MNGKAAKRVRRELREVMDGDPVETEVMGKALADRVGLKKLAREFGREYRRRERRQATDGQAAG